MATINLKTLDKATEKLDKQFVSKTVNAYKTSMASIEGQIKELFDKYGVDGKLDFSTLSTVSLADKNKLTRFNTALDQIGKEVKSLTSGQAEAIKNLTSQVWEQNTTGTLSALAKATGSTSLELVNREGVYQMATNPVDNLKGTLSKEAMDMIETDSEYVIRTIEKNTAKTVNDIRSAMTTSIASGESIGQMTKRVRESMSMSANRAVRIARTETTGAMGRARLQSMETAQAMGIKVIKEWVSTIDDRTRESHVQLNRNVKPIDQPFANGLMYPGDPSGEPEECINCRCTMVTDLMDYDNDGNLIEGTDASLFEAQDSYNRESLEFYNNSVRWENKITGDLTQVARENGMTQYGLDFRTKDVNSYLRKVNSRFDEMVEKAGGDLSKIKSYKASDIVRYTYTNTTDDLVDGYMTSIQTLQSKGYELRSVNNAWMDLKNPYNGININLTSPQGVRFELQYHTYEGIIAKEKEAHPYYEAQRIIKDKKSPKWLELQEKMFEIYNKLTKPVGIEKIVGFE